MHEHDITYMELNTYISSSNTLHEIIEIPFPSCLCFDLLIFLFSTTCFVLLIKIEFIIYEKYSVTYSYSYLYIMFRRTLAKFEKFNTAMGKSITHSDLKFKPKFTNGIYARTVWKKILQKWFHVIYFDLIIIVAMYLKKLRPYCLYQVKKKNND